MTKRDERFISKNRAELKKLLHEIDRIEDEIERLMEIYESESDTETESKIDSLMDESVEARKQIADRICRMTLHRIDYDTAYAMTFTHKLHDIV